MTLALPQGLARASEVIANHQLPAIALWTLEPHLSSEQNRSRLGGAPLLPPGFEWPSRALRPLDFLLQLDLRAIAPLVPPGTLPDRGLLTFFYDLDNQPWGFDPKDSDGSKVVLISEPDLTEVPGPDPQFYLPQRWLDFGPSVTLPTIGSRAYDRLAQCCSFTDAELDMYLQYQDQFERQFYPFPSGLHRLFGHSSNVQGDMQLEAELVSHGLYCGDSSGYNDPQRQSLESNADKWLLLLQLDSDEAAGTMWGDVGMLYFWIREDDLEQRRFERAWLSLQCS